MYFFVPFYPLRFESGLKKQEGEDGIAAELERLSDSLYQAGGKGELSEREVLETAAYTRLVLQHLTKGLDEGIQERMVNMMGGSFWELETDELFDTIDELKSQIRHQ